VLAALTMLPTTMAATASAAPPSPAPPPVRTIHPIFAASDTPLTDVIHKQFSGAVARRNLGPVEVMDIPGPPPPKAKDLLTTGREAVEQKKFPEAEAALKTAITEVTKSGGAGLTTAELGDLFLYYAMALQKADWKDPPTPFTEITPPEAKDAYLQAVTLIPDRSLLPRQFPGLAIASWKLALAESNKRGRANLVVRAPGTALVSIDAGPLKSGMLPALDLRQGQHFIRVEDPGRKLFATTVTLNQPSHEIEVPPQPIATLPDGPPAASAKRQGAAFALVAELRPGSPATVELRLIQALTATRRDSATVPASDASAFEAAVVHLEEIARKERFDQSKAAVLNAPALGQIALAPVEARATVSTGARLTESPGAWAKERWPLLTAVGVAVGSALVLGVLVAHDDGR
jgi:hypothetical protein